LIDFDWFSNGTIIDGTITLLIFNDWFRFWLILRLDFQWSDMIMNMYEYAYLGCHGDKNPFKMTWLLYGAFQDVPFSSLLGIIKWPFFHSFPEHGKNHKVDKGWIASGCSKTWFSHSFPIVFPCCFEILGCLWFFTHKNTQDVHSWHLLLRQRYDHRPLLRLGSPEIWRSKGSDLIGSWSGYICLVVSNMNLMFHHMNGLSETHWRSLSFFKMVVFNHQPVMNCNLDELSYIYIHIL